MSAMRTDKTTDPDTAVSVVRVSDHVAIGGIWSHNSPAALVRALIRHGAGELTISAGPAAGFAVDLLISSGLVKRAYLPNVTFEHLGLAPAFRAAVESGTVELIECDEPSLVGGYRAAGAGLPGQTIASIRGTDLSVRRPDIGARTVAGRQVLEVPALAPDVVLLHAQQSDAYGNARQHGTVFADRVMARAAERAVIVSADELISNEQIRNDPKATTLPCYLVDQVVPLPFAAHPCGSHGFYGADEDHLREYIDAQAQNPAAYAERYIQAGHESYLAAAGGERLLAERLSGAPG